MPSRLMGILACVLLAYVANYALDTWLDSQIPRWIGPEATVDGSTLNTSQYYRFSADTSLATTADREALLDFYAYLDRGGRRAYLDWRTADRSLRVASTDFLHRALSVAGQTNTAKYLAIGLLILALLLLFGGGLGETAWSTPPLYLLLFGGTTYLYGALSAPLLTGLVVLLLLIYYGSIRLFLPIYHTEWVRMMRPGLTLCVFLLATMAIRGPELIDYWFWTSQLYRFALVLVVLLTVFFHLSILTRVLRNSGMDAPARTFAYGIPLGVTLVTTGLVTGLYGAPGAGLTALNAELVALPPAALAAVDPNQPFVLFFAGALLLIAGAIGYFIRRISR